MRIHLAVGLPRRGNGSAAVVATEHIRIARPEPLAKESWEHVVALIAEPGQRPEDVLNYILKLVNSAKENMPWLVIDGGAGYGMSLYQAIMDARNDGRYPKGGPAGPIPHPSVYRPTDRQRQEL